MEQNTSVVVNFGNTAEAITIGVKIEVRQSDGTMSSTVYTKDTARIYIYCSNPTILEGLQLFDTYAQQRSLSAPSSYTHGSIETVSFRGGYDVSVQYPIKYLRTVKTLTAIAEVKNKSVCTRYSRGSEITNKFTVVNNSIFMRNSPTGSTDGGLYGDLYVSYVCATHRTGYWQAPSKLGVDSASFPFFIMYNGAVVSTFDISVSQKDYTPEETEAAYEDDSEDSEDVSESGSLTKVDALIKLVDVCSGALIVGASVYINKRYRGVTDESGVLAITEYSGTYEFKAIKTGYYRTDEDGLDNDFITIG